jgi:hypothetical protein
MSDIKFNTSDQVVVEGSALKVTSPDIMLDHGPRRRAGAPASVPRRALVHDFNDSLTLNWAEDYPNGVTINGKVSCPKEIITEKITGNRLTLTHFDLCLDNAGRRRAGATPPMRRAFVHDFTDGLTLNWDRDYPGGVTINGVVTCPNTLKVGTTDIGATIQQLLTRITQLEARVTALGG